MSFFVFYLFLFVYFYFFFPLRFLTCLLFFSNTIKRNKSRLNRRLNPGLKSALFLIFFFNVQQISQVVPSKSALCSKVSFFLILCVFFFWVFCWVSVFQLFLFCLFFCFSDLFFIFSRFFWIVFYYFFFSLILEFCEEFFFTTIYILYIDYIFHII